jgi:hypothetical protein
MTGAEALEQAQLHTVRSYLGSEVSRESILPHKQIGGGEERTWKEHLEERNGFVWSVTVNISPSVLIIEKAKCNARTLEGELGKFLGILED